MDQRIKTNFWPEKNEKSRTGNLKNLGLTRTSTDPNRDQEKFENLGPDRTRANKILKLSDQFEDERAAWGFLIQRKFRLF